LLEVERRMEMNKKPLENGEESIAVTHAKAAALFLDLMPMCIMFNAMSAIGKVWLEAEASTKRSGPPI